MIVFNYVTLKLFQLNLISLNNANVMLVKEMANRFLRTWLWEFQDVLNCNFQNYFAIFKKIFGQQLGFFHYLFVFWITFSYLIRVNPKQIRKMDKTFSLNTDNFELSMNDKITEPQQNMEFLISETDYISILTSNYSVQ